MADVAPRNPRAFLSQRPEVAYTKLPQKRLAHSQAFSPSTRVKNRRENIASLSNLDAADAGNLQSCRFQPGCEPQKLCALWSQDPSSCRKGEACFFAHGVHELALEIRKLIGSKTQASSVEEKARSSSSDDRTGGPISWIRPRHQLEEQQVPRPRHQLDEQHVPRVIPSRIAPDAGRWHVGSVQRRQTEHPGEFPRVDSRDEAQPGMRSSSSSASSAAPPERPAAYRLRKQVEQVESPPVFQHNKSSGTGTAQSIRYRQQEAEKKEIANSSFPTPSRFQAGAGPMKMCTYWVRSPSSCLKGSACCFAHGAHELHESVKMDGDQTETDPAVICRHFAAGHCRKGIQCKFVHLQTEEDNVTSKRCSTTEQRIIGDPPQGRIMLLVPDDYVRRAIGAHGNVVEDIATETQTSIHFSRPERSADQRQLVTVEPLCNEADVAGAAARALRLAFNVNDDNDIISTTTLLRSEVATTLVGEDRSWIQPLETLTSTRISLYSALAEEGIEGFTMYGPCSGIESLIRAIAEADALSDYA